MVRATVLHQTHFFIPPEDHSKIPELNDFKLKEQECVSQLKKCNNMEEFKQSHCQILKLGLFWSSFCSSNLATTCALSDWGSMDYALSIFEQIEDPSSFVFNAMIRGHVNDMNLEEAILLYDQMLQMGIEPDNFTYPILLKACARFPRLEEGMQIHGHIFKLGLGDDVFVQNSLINMYGKCGDVKGSCSVFRQIDDRSVASWSAIIAAHASKGMWNECLSFFGELFSSEKCWRVEESILVNVLSSCTHLGDLELGRCTHGYLIRNLSGLNVIVETSLIDMYVKCGSLEKGSSLFERMREKNELSYSVMISGLTAHVRGVEALRVFSEMLEEGFEPDDVVYVGVLKACSHAGLVEEGLEFFNKMRLEHRIPPTIHHYGCLVDLLGQAGRLNETFELVKSMPMEANDVVWRSLVTACRIHQNVELGEYAAKKLLESSANNAGDYLIVSSMYAQAQRWEKVAAIRTEMVGKGLIQTPGFCSVEVKRKLYKFISYDTSQPHCKGINDILYQMEWQLRFEGYSPDTSQVLLDVDEEEKRERLGRHCQKLAIGFALLHTPKGSPIRIVRNLRMCKDCHTYTKLISFIYERRITVKDRNRFHHFQDGTCSCRDYW